MAKKKNKATFKNEYIIDMAKLNSRPIIWTPSDAELPVETINGQTITWPTPDKFVRLFSERQVKHMIAQYPVLFPMLNKDARTITEYLSADGKPLITIYPNAEIDVHDPDWQNGLSRDALFDLHNMYQKRKQEIESMRGVLNELTKK